jgi:hypothetical protein
MKIIERFKLPDTRCIRDLDDPAATLLHAEIIQKKPFLRKLYVDFYKQLEKVVSNPEGRVLVELGSGAGFIKEVISNAITSDILELPNVDRVFSALEMPFEKASVDAFFMFDVLHHITDPRAFFREAFITSVLTHRQNGSWIPVKRGLCRKQGLFHMEMVHFHG